MAINLDNIATKVMKLMQGSGLQMKMFDATEGKSVATPDNARYFYVKEPNMMVHIDDSTRELKFHIGEDIDIDNPDINNMMKQLKTMARTNMLDFDIRSFGKHIEPKNYTYKIEQNKEQTMTDNVNEGMGPLSGSSKTSRQTLENVRLIVKHQKAVNEEQRGARSRNISSLFVENADGERFKYPFKHLNGARAMARHVSTGGVPSDVVGESIVELSSNLAKLKEFMNVVNKQKLVNESNRSVVSNVKRSMNSIKESIKRIQGARGYASFVEGIALKEESESPSEITEDTINSYVKKFTKSTFEESLKDIIPLVHKVNEEETVNRRVNQVDRVKEIMSATVKKTGEKVNTISFGDSRDPEYDYSQIKKQYAEPRTPEEASQRKVDMIAMTFDDLSDRVVVDTLLDKKQKKKGHDLAAEISFFLTDIANDIRANPAGVDKEEIKVAGHLLKMSKATIEKIEPKSADIRISEMLEEAFSKFNVPGINENVRRDMLIEELLALEEGKLGKMIIGLGLIAAIGAGIGAGGSDVDTSSSQSVVSTMQDAGMSNSQIDAASDLPAELQKVVANGADDASDMSDQEKVSTVLDMAGKFDKRISHAKVHNGDTVVLYGDWPSDESFTPNGVAHGWGAEFEGTHIKFVHLQTMDGDHVGGSRVGQDWSQGYHGKPQGKVDW